MNPPFSISQSRGQDANTAARHLRSALDHLLPGGRVVAIMPDWFTPSAKYAHAFRHTLEGARVVLSLRLDKGAYAKHGTGIAVRVLVIDKVAGDISVSTINRQARSRTLRGASRHPAAGCAARIHAALSPPRRQAEPLPRGEKRACAPGRDPCAAQTNEVSPVAYVVLDEPAPMGEQRGVYADYRPSRLVLPGGWRTPDAPRRICRHGVDRCSQTATMCPICPSAPSPRGSCQPPSSKP